MIQTGITNLLAQSSYDTSGKFQVNMLGKDADGKPQSINVDIGVGGSQDRPFQGGAGFNQKVAASVKVNQDIYTGDLEMRNKDKNIFIIINALTGPEEQVPKEQLSQILAKWWKIPLPDSVYSKMAPENAESITSMLKTNWSALTGYLKSVDYEGVEMVGGSKSYHYVATVDLGKVQSFLEGYSKSQGAEVTEEQMKSFQDMFGSAKAVLDVWVSMDAQTLSRMKATVKMDKIIGDDGKTAGKADAVLDVSYSDFGKVVTIDEPAGAAVFDLFSMFGGALDETTLEGSDDLEGDLSAQ